MNPLKERFLSENMLKLLVNRKMQTKTTFTRMANIKTTNHVKYC